MTDIEPEELVMSEYLFFLKALKAAANVDLFPCTFETDEKYKVGDNEYYLKIKFTSPSDHTCTRDRIYTMSMPAMSTSFVQPLMRRVYPQLVAKDPVTCQPMISQ
jgi:hypothetical protein